MLRVIHSKSNPVLRIKLFDSPPPSQSLSLDTQSEIFTLHNTIYDICVTKRCAFQNKELKVKVRKMSSPVYQEICHGRFSVDALKSI